MKRNCRRASVSAHGISAIPLWLVLCAVPGIATLSQSQGSAPSRPATEQEISSAEFCRIVREFSEEDGFFRSDNFVSNETSYLHILDKLTELGSPGGAYIGVGPEQNFTYIAKTRPSIAFIVDIRRQAVIQHLMLKAVFHRAADRVAFLSILFSKPAAQGSAPGKDVEVAQLLDYFERTPTSNDYFASNLAGLQETVQEEIGFRLDPRDLAALEYIYTSFRDENLNIQYRSGSGNWSSPRWGGFPTLKELILEPDLKGKAGNFLASERDFQFVRALQIRNRIIPVVGNFAGARALPAVGDYLSCRGYFVSTFYTSNVEQYLFSNGVFEDFAANVRRLPINNRSLFIRAFPNMREAHPARVPGHRLTTLLQKIEVFLRDQEKGLHTDYWSLVTSNFISANGP